MISKQKIYSTKSFRLKPKMCNSSLKKFVTAYSLLYNGNSSPKYVLRYVCQQITRMLETIGAWKK
jgi:hypothetical protein